MITQFDRKRLVNNLPDAYSKDEGSNNAKILEIEKRTLDELRESVGALYECLEIEKAYGRTLDLYGEMFGQARGISTDEQYRVLIKNRIVRNFANADFNSIVNAIAMTFGSDPADIVLKELDEPCKVTLEGLPISQLNASNIDITTAVQIVNGLIPVGVHMDSVSFSGTFEFSGGTEMVYSEEAGFADEGQTIGGYLGLVSDGSGSNLPV